MPVWDLSATARIVFKIFVFGTFVIALGIFSIWFVSFMDDIYQILRATVSNIGSTNLPPLVGCALNALGIDTFINSAFAIFFSAAVFWVTAVAYIIAYKLGNKAYDGLFKAAT